jgi:oxygen-independent coproporphyrinogen-3 oxidase
MAIPEEYRAKVGGDPLRTAFDKPFLGGAMTDRRLGITTEKSSPPSYEGLWSQGAEPPLNVYINIPFCTTFCPFCGFFKAKYTLEDEKSYLEALLREMETEKEHILKSGLKIETVFIGGGTPSSFSAQGLKSLISGIKALPLADDAEITMEGRISVLDDDKISEIFSGVINRFSVGIQSFDKEVRNRSGRSDPPDKVKEVLKNIISAKKGAILTLDLIYGLPLQTLAIFKKDLDEAADIGADGVSLYLLKLMPNSKLFRDDKDGLDIESKSIPDLAEYYRIAVEYLPQRGFTQLSNTHFTRTPDDRNLYNSYSMGRRDLIAFGAGAGGFMNGASYMNVPNLEKYKAAVKENKKPIMMFRDPPPNHKLLDAVSHDIIKGGLRPKSLASLPPKALLTLTELLDQWEESGLLTKEKENESDSYRLTSAGLFWRANMEWALRGLLNSELSA